MLNLFFPKKKTAKNVEHEFKVQYFKYFKIRENPNVVGNKHAKVGKKYIHQHYNL